ncbi:MAG TPA: type I-E CRISPR-associated protein Cse2/CasB [Gammaproteobacteria bacterium]|nr:type I-E CRISPR-associated protein Cse2/CasB [Gammaproteobacteria bacterium]
MSIRFKAENPAGEALRAWLERLDKNHGDRASIRRCRDAGAVAFQPAFVRFFISDLRPLFGPQAGAMRLAGIFGLASHLDGNKPCVLGTGDSMARQMASSRPGQSGGPRISELRFRRLLQYERDDLYRPMLRIIRALHGEANVYDLADAVYYWGDNVRKRWAFDYFPYSENR